MAKKAKKATVIPDAAYEAARREWEAKRRAVDRGGGEWLTERPALPVDPLPFLQTLRGLGYITQDQRFAELLRYVMESDLIDRATSKWSLVDTKVTGLLPELVDQVAAGTSDRQAIADAVATFGLYLDAQGFEAAFKRLERLLQEWRRKSVRQEPA